MSQTAESKASKEAGQAANDQILTANNDYESFLSDSQKNVDTLVAEELSKEW